jgi:L,D-peptidoglycan transpeptidase YkuD (ErfK/YbiS/YcfS/YnhG family)
MYSTETTITSARLAPRLPNPVVESASVDYRAVSQLIVVSADGWGTNEVTVTTHRRVDDAWHVDGPGVTPGFIGPKGFTSHPSELDWHTPVGSYAITDMWGHLPDPGCLFPYRQVHDGEWWVDDPNSPLYNTWQSGPSDGRWESAEWLAMYPLAFVFDFNQSPVVPHRNSAIFFHEGDGPTAGCIAVPRPHLIEIMRWLDPALQPRIILGVNATVPD